MAASLAAQCLVRCGFVSRESKETGKAFGINVGINIYE